ncbi:hypothetical protein [Rhodococcus gannanensis]|uniref:Uncharacterized protein n=1 Tax=Rhodococcus gannanensis TaxID=1960308 RepID=A0ABW4P5S6_9NOCA
MKSMYAWCGVNYFGTVADGIGTSGTATAVRPGNTRAAGLAA